MIPTNLFPEYGGLAAQGAGHGLGGLLGQVGGVLSAPRRALWSMLGLPESGAEVVGGEGDRDSPWAQALGMGLEVAGDPLTWLGGPLLRGLGLGAGQAATKAAWLKGPEYGADATKFATAAGIDVGSPMAQKLAARVGDPQKAIAMLAGNEDIGPLSTLLKGESPENLARLSQELPEGSTLLGKGREGVAYGVHPSGVVRIERNAGMPPRARPRAPEMLQPIRNVTLGNTRLEHLPLVETPASQARPLEEALGRAGGNRSEVVDAMEALAQRQRGVLDAVSRSARGRGLVDEDLAGAGGIPNINNLGFTPGGRALALDPNALGWPGAPGWPGAGPLVPSTDLGQRPGRVGSLLSTLLGGRDRLRDYLRQGYQSGAVGQGIPV